MESLSSLTRRMIEQQAVFLLTTSKSQRQGSLSHGVRGTDGQQGPRMARGSGSPEAEKGRTGAREQALCVSVVQTLVGMRAAGFCSGRAVRVW